MPKSNQHQYILLKKRRKKSVVTGLVFENKTIPEVDFGLLKQRSCHIARPGLNRKAIMQRFKNFYPSPYGTVERDIQFITPLSGSAGEWLKFSDHYVSMNNFGFLNSGRLFPIDTQGHFCYTFNYLNP